MKKINSIDSLKVAQGVLLKLESAIRAGNGIKVEFIELFIEDVITERIYCAYCQTEDGLEAILYEGMTHRFYYIKSEILELPTKKVLPHLFLLDTGVHKAITKSIQDKMLLVVQSRETISLEIEDFGTKFTISRPAK